MRRPCKAALGAACVALLASVGPSSACPWQRNAAADTSTRLAQAGEAARPAREPQSQTSVPTAAPAATTGQTTGATDQPPVVKQMNEEEKNKVEKEGK